MKYPRTVITGKPSTGKPFAERVELVERPAPRNRYSVLERWRAMMRVSAWGAAEWQRAAEALDLMLSMLIEQQEKSLSARLRAQRVLKVERALRRAGHPERGLNKAVSKLVTFPISPEAIKKIRKRRKGTK